ncbi:hypothetical protein G9A89_015980 [Geosiphon pyriformis]|nr:hypothetical protein G9A89_015980 [Geosiphon pyriformis]
MLNDRGSWYESPFFGGFAFLTSRSAYRIDWDCTHVKTSILFVKLLDVKLPSRSKLYHEARVLVKLKNLGSPQFFKKVPLFAIDFENGLLEEFTGKENLIIKFAPEEAFDRSYGF